MILDFKNIYRLNIARRKRTQRAIAVLNVSKSSIEIVTFSSIIATILIFADIGY